jgi:hypothetical protein
MKNIYDELLLSFCSKDDMHQKVAYPSMAGQYAYATDMTKAIRIPVRMIARNYGEPKVGFVRIFDRPKVDPVKIDCEKLREFIGGIPKEDAYEMCEQCEGTGQVLCPCCENIDDCRECRGLGHNGKKIGKKIPDYAIISILGSIYKVDNIETLVEVAEKLEAQIRIVSERTSGIAIFEIGADVSVAICTTMARHDSKIFELEI